jgi:hypothetical protein
LVSKKLKEKKFAGERNLPSVKELCWVVEDREGRD